MDTREIQPIITWSTESGDTTLTTLCLKDFYHYFFDDGGGKVNYTLQADGLDILSGTVDIPSYIVQQWGQSDEIIFEYVATSLNLILIP
jgi:hypothetical protein